MSRDTEEIVASTYVPRPQHVAWCERAAKTKRIHIAEWLMEWIIEGDLPGWSREGDVLTMEWPGGKVIWKLTGNRNARGALEAVWPD